MNQSISEAEQKKKLLEAIQLKEQMIALREGLPFLHGWPWYEWAQNFFESNNKINLLCAANQISKSSTQIRKCIEWATNKDKWPLLWRRAPVQFWYLYPSQKVVNAEYLTKWLLFLPKGKYKDDPVYGYTMEKKDGNVVALHFNSGVHVFFKMYSQSPEDLQTGTCDAIFCDEELPMELFDELMNRLNATDGYFHMVFTATLGQEFWRKCLEPRDDEEENLPQAHKQVVSLYDSMKYVDGTPSPWTAEKIAAIKARCSTHQEFLKRVMGKFIVLGGRKCEAFDATRHVKPKHQIPPTWLIYEGVDIGGGGKSHKSAICFIGVRPDFRAGRVFLGWRGDEGNTTAGDVFKKHIELKTEAKLKPVLQCYDWAAKDFGTIAERAGEPFTKAEKGQDLGADLLNTLFKNDILAVYEDVELMKLVGELCALQVTTPKEKAKDDFYDALRFSVTRVPWDLNFIGTDEKPKETADKTLNAKEQEIADRREAFDPQREAAKELEEEFEEWNSLYEGH